MNIGKKLKLNVKKKCLSLQKHQGKTNKNNLLMQEKKILIEKKNFLS